MLKSVVIFSLRHSGVVFTLAVALLLFGIYRLPSLSYDVFPEFAPPQVVIQTEAPGLSPEQVEILVTQPLENVLTGVSGIESLRSGSLQSLSLITATFQSGTDIYRARQMISERLTSASGQLPIGVHAPGLTPLTSSTSVVMIIGLTSDSLSQMEIRSTAQWVVRQRLLSVPGVSKVAVFGGQVREIQIQVSSDQLLRYDLSIDDAVKAARKATGIRGAGFFEDQNQRLTITPLGQPLTAAEIARTVMVHTRNGNVSLGDVATVRDAPEPPIGAASIMGKPGVQLVVSSQLGTNTLEVTRGLDAALEELKPQLNARHIVLQSDLFRPARFIDTALGNVRSSLLIGVVLVIFVLLFFLWNIRTAVISITAIPLSLITAILILDAFGYSVNTMTLGGLAIAIGLVVDDAIIDVENVYRRLRENVRSETPKPVGQVVLSASLEVRNAIVYATVAIALVFVPVLTMSGVAGKIFAPLAVAFILATLASLVVALTVTPALCSLLLTRTQLGESVVISFLKKRYTNLLERIERRPKALLVGVGLVTIVAVGSLPFLGGSFIPELKEGHFIIHMSAVPGTSLVESQRLGNQVTQALLELPSVRSVCQRIGRAEAADDVYGSHYSEFSVDLKPLKGEESEFALADIRAVLARFPGVNFAVKTFLTERVEETVSGYTAAVAVELFGQDLVALDTKANEVARVLASVPGAMEIQVQSPPGAPQISIRLRPDDIAHWGLTPVEVLDAIQIANQGEVVGQVYEGNQVYDVAVILAPNSRVVAEVGSLPIRNNLGETVFLKQLADIYQTSGRYIVLHEGAQRVQTITCNVGGRDVASFVTEARHQIADAVKLSAGMYVTFGGTAEAQTRSRRDLLVHSLAILVAIVVLMAIVTANGRNLILVIVNLPLALVGGVLAVFMTGGMLSIGSLVGFVTLFGVSLRNSIMLVSHYEHLVREEGVKWNFETALRGAAERMAPIVMTALVTAVGVLPLAVGSGDPGREIEGPMAIVILGGLVTSTILNLLLLPTLALKYGRFGTDTASQDISL